METKTKQVNFRTPALLFMKEFRVGHFSKGKVFLAI